MKKSLFIVPALVCFPLVIGCAQPASDSGAPAAESATADEGSDSHGDGDHDDHDHEEDSDSHDEAE